MTGYLRFNSENIFSKKLEDFNARQIIREFKKGLLLSDSNEVKGIQSYINYRHNINVSNLNIYNYDSIENIESIIKENSTKHVEWEWATKINQTYQDTLVDTTNINEHIRNVSDLYITKSGSYYIFYKNMFKTYCPNNTDMNNNTILVFEAVPETIIPFIFLNIKGINYFFNDLLPIETLEQSENNSLFVEKLYKNILTKSSKIYWNIDTNEITIGDFTNTIVSKNDNMKYNYHYFNYNTKRFPYNSTKYNHICDIFRISDCIMNNVLTQKENDYPKYDVLNNFKTTLPDMASYYSADTIDNINKILSSSNLNYNEYNLYTLLNVFNEVNTSIIYKVIFTVVDIIECYSMLKNKNIMTSEFIDDIRGKSNNITEFKYFNYVKALTSDEKFKDKKIVIRTLKSINNSYDNMGKFTEDVIFNILKNDKPVRYILRDGLEHVETS